MLEGQTQRFDCDGCSKEFEVTLEPKMRGKPPGRRATGAQVKHCPFCGTGNPTHNHGEADEDVDAAARKGFDSAMSSGRPNEDKGAA